MADNARKTHLALYLNQTASGRSNDAIKVLGKNLPLKVVSVNGQIVTVEFQVQQSPYTFYQVTMPIHAGIYDWYPVQEGDLGVAVSGDTYLGGISDLGGGTADLSQRANLSTLWFVPISNKNWQPPGGDPNKRILQGPNGVRLQDTNGHTILELDNQGNVTITGTLTISGNLTVNGSTTTVNDINIQGSESGGGPT